MRQAGGGFSLKTAIHEQMLEGAHPVVERSDTTGRHTTNQRIPEGYKSVPRVCPSPVSRRLESPSIPLVGRLFRRMYGEGEGTGGAAMLNRRLRTLRVLGTPESTETWMLESDSHVVPSFRDSVRSLTQWMRLKRCFLDIDQSFPHRVTSSIAVSTPLP